MLKISRATRITTDALNSDVNGNDRLLRLVDAFFGATTIKFVFPHVRDDARYYVLWSSSENFDTDVHRSEPLTPAPGTPLGTMLEKTVIGFEPESEVYFKVVSNPDLLRGEQ
jgi:hypothetical protein